MPPSITAYFVAPDYWHTEVWLRSAKGEKVRFFSKEHNIAPLFDVSAIEAELPSGEPPQWNRLGREIMVASVEPLWRDEWLERGASGPTVGNNPHTQFSGRVGAASDSAVVSATVLAGVHLREAHGPGITLIASPYAPLNIDIAADVDGVSKVLHEHSRGGWDNAV